MLKIVKYPHPALRYASVPVVDIDDELRGWVREMFALMYENRGIGLAANQVDLPFRFFVLNLTADPDRPDQERVIINPELDRPRGQIEDEEGCLSFPGLYARVQRAKKVRLKAFDLEGTEVEIHAEDLLSRAIQHETDHLEGRLFIDYLQPDVLKSLEPKIRGYAIDHQNAQAAGELASDHELLHALSDRARRGSRENAAAH